MGNKSYFWWIDRYKGLLISLIVLGHVLGGAPTHSGTMNTLWQAIYMFHVPAFFVVVGLTWPDQQRPIGEFITKRFARLIIPYFIWGLFSLLAYYVLIDHSFSCVGTDVLSLVAATSWIPNHVIKSNSVLWFPPCMFTSLLIYWMIARIFSWQRFKWVHLALIPVLWFLHQYLVFHVNIGYFPYGFVTAMRYVTFIILGRLVGAARLETMIENCARWKYVSLGIVLFVLMFSLLKMVELHHGQIFTGYSYGFCKFPIMFIASVAALLIMCGIRVRFLELLGVHSLGIMLTHKFVVVALQTRIMASPGCWECLAGLPASLFVTCLATGGGLFVSLMSKRYVPWAVGFVTLLKNDKRTNG